MNRVILSAIILFAFGLVTAEAQQAAQQPEQSPAQKYFSDVQLVNQNGEKMRLYTDLLQGKTVIINSFFATCQGSCLPMMRNLEKVQEALGDRLGKDARIISKRMPPSSRQSPAGIS
jgi:protein SCO1